MAIRRMSRVSALVLVSLGVAGNAETPSEWVQLLTRVHGGFGSFLPVGIRIGEDAMRRLGAKARELDVTFYQGDGTPCPCAADGVMLAVQASPGQGTLHIAAEKSPPGSFAVVVVRSRKGSDAVKYTVPMSLMPKLIEINREIAEPLGRYNAVLALRISSLLSWCISKDNSFRDAGMSSPHDNRPPEDADGENSRTEQLRRVLEEYADELRVMLEKLRRMFNN